MLRAEYTYVMNHDGVHHVIVYDEELVDVKCK